MKKFLLPILLLLAAVAVIYFIEARQAAPATVRDIDPASVSPDTVRYPPGAPQLAYLKIQTVHSSPAPLFAPVTARLVYDEDRTYRALAPVSGRVLEILVNPGDRVRRGQALARLASPDYATAVADRDKAQADLRAKRATASRAELLLQAGVIARKDFEAAEADLGMATAEARRAEQHLQALGMAGDVADADFLLRSRIDGVVAERQISAGQEVRSDAASPLFVVTDPTHLWLSIDVSEQALGQIHRGQALDVRVDADPERHFRATVASVGVSLDPATRRLPVMATLDNADGELHPEMFAQVCAIDEQRAPMVLLPNSAIFTKGLYSYVWIETAEGTLQRRRIHLALQLPDRSYVSAGVGDGERVVTSGALLLDADTTAG